MLSKILAVETSCDDTSVAIVRGDGFVVFNKVHSQEVEQGCYGGVVPEIASRNHAKRLLPLIEEALVCSKHRWSDIDALAVTSRPGLVGALIAGLVTVKTLSFLLDKLYVAVNHIEGHILSAFLWDRENSCPSLEFPFLALIVSGGHTSLFLVKGFGEYFSLAQTVDDSAGEALDKVARALGLGYPGGAVMDKMSLSVSAKGLYVFPKVSLKSPTLNFSFSGLKTSALRFIQGDRAIKNQELMPAFCADFQMAIVDHLMDRLDGAISMYDCRSVVIAGGVSANSRLRKKALAWAHQKKLRCFYHL